MNSKKNTGKDVSRQFLMIFFFVSFLLVALITGCGGGGGGSGGSGNKNPVATDQEITTDEDIPITISLPATDADGSSLTYLIVANPGNGSLGSVSGNTITYTPNANYNGLDTFTFKANDGSADSNTATVTITITPINDGGPTAQSVSDSTEEDTAISIPLIATDPDPEDTLIFSIVSTPSNGSLGPISGNTITYTPNSNYNSLDTFTYKTNDGTIDSNTATVSITVNAVNDEPIISGTPPTTATEDVAYSYTGISASDVDVGDTLTFSMTGNPTWLSIDPATGELSGTPLNVNVDTTTGIVITVKDVSNTPASLPAFDLTVTAVNDSPIANAGANQSIGVGTVVTLDGTASSDEEGVSLTYSWTQTGGTTVSLSDATVAQPTFTTPTDVDTSENLNFSLIVNDGNSNSTTGTVTITVNDNAAPSDITGLTAHSYGNQIQLSWTDSITSDYQGVILRRDTTITPSNPLSDGVLAADVAVGLEGLAEGGMTHGTIYHYTAFAYDEALNYSNGVSISVTYYDSGTLDLNFGGDYGGDGIPDGYVVYDNAAGGNGEDWGRAITIDGNGKILVAGVSRSTTLDMVVWRLTENGSLDLTFGEDSNADSIPDGYSIHNNAAGGNGDDFGNAILTDIAGNIYITGSSFEGSSSDMVIWRYDQNGNLDNTFSGNGYVAFNNSGGNRDLGYCMAFDLDGKIIVAGTSNFANGQGGNMMIWRYKTDGSLDTTFNGIGHVDSHLLGQENAYRCAVDSNNNILTSGYAASSGTDMAIWRYSQNGIIDSSFNSSGYLLYNNGGSEIGSSITEVNGKILVGGRINNGTDDDIALWKFNADGTNDTTFGVDYDLNGTADGLKIFDTGQNELIDSMVLDSQGRIILKGYIFGGIDAGMIVMRYLSDGTIDSTFATTGYVLIRDAIVAQEYEDFESLAIDQSGRIVVTGRTWNGLDHDMTVWRINP